MHFRVPRIALLGYDVARSTCLSSQLCRCRVAVVRRSSLVPALMASITVGASTYLLVDGRADHVVMGDGTTHTFRWRTKRKPETLREFEIRVQQAVAATQVGSPPCRGCTRHAYLICIHVVCVFVSHRGSLRTRQEKDSKRSDLTHRQPANRQSAGSAWQASHRHLLQSFLGHAGRRSR